MSQRKPTRTWFAIVALSQAAACNLANSTSDTSGIGTFKKTKTESQALADGDKDDVNFPTLSYFASGMIGTRIGDKDMKQDIVTTIDYENLGINVVNNDSTNSNVRKRIVDKRGLSEFPRADKKAITELGKTKDNYKKAAPFVIFGTGYRKGGISITFTDPIPVFIAPKPACRYNALDEDSLTFTTQATIAGGELNGMRFTIDVTIRKIGGGGGDAELALKSEKKPACDEFRKVNIETTVSMKNKNGQEDPTGKLYATLPMAHQSVYEIDASKDMRAAAKNPTISRIWTSSFLEDGGKRRNSNFLYKLCNVENGEAPKKDASGDEAELWINAKAKKTTPAEDKKAEAAAGEDDSVLESDEPAPDKSLTEILGDCRVFAPGEFRGRPR